MTASICWVSFEFFTTLMPEEVVKAATSASSIREPFCTITLVPQQIRAWILLTWKALLKESLAWAGSLFPISTGTGSSLIPSAPAEAFRRLEDEFGTFPESGGELRRALGRALTDAELELSFVLALVASECCRWQRPVQ